MILEGLIKERPYSEGEALAIGDKFLAAEIEELTGQRVYCCYAFANRPISYDDLLPAAIATAEGIADGQLNAVYSEITGFLWVDEEGKIGGHNLLDIFRSHTLEYGVLVIQKTPIELTCKECEENSFEEDTDTF